MIALRVALLAVLLAAAGVARGQQDTAADVAPALRPAVAAYRAGDLGTAEAAFRSLAPHDADAEAWLGALLLDRGAEREGLRLIPHSAHAGPPRGAPPPGLGCVPRSRGAPRPGHP